jgi:GrpB-like predicted nucleotidyltransferase (UPF0157 family)
MNLAERTRTWPAYLLGTSAHGTWFYVPAGISAGELIENPALESAQLVPDDDWWVGWWWADGSITVDIATPAAFATASVRYVDLELGLSAKDGDHGLSRQEEYQAARNAGLINNELDRSVRAAAARLGRAMVERVEPFGEEGWQWLGRIRRNELHVVAYDPSWPIKFAEAREQMLPVLPVGSRVEHFGSTSVPGLAAKDCIDIAVVMRQQDQFNEAIAGLESIGYEARPNAFDDPGHIFLRRLTAASRRTHHLHLYHEGHPNLIEVLAFRDLLRTDADARNRYQTVKLGLAEANPYDRSGYLAGKSEVVQDLLRIALERWRSDTGLR